MRGTFHRDVALAETEEQLLGVIHDLPPIVVASARRQLDNGSAEALTPVERRLAGAANHLVTSIQAGNARTAGLLADVAASQAAAERDQLTGLRNRHFLKRFLGSIDRPVDLLTVLIDVDDLKHINDTHGHAAGDAALTAVASVLRENSRPNDVVIRWGGDEFLLLVSHTDPEPSSALVVGERLASAIRHARPAAPWEHLELSASIGVCGARRTALPMPHLDATLYQAKRDGKGCAVLAPEHPDSVVPIS